MDNGKDDVYYLKRIITDLEFIIKNTADLTRAELEANEILTDSVMFRLIQVSENSDKLSESLKCAHSDISWRAMKGMRNRIVHVYGSVDLTVIYDTISEDIPDLLRRLEHIIGELTEEPEKQ